MSGLIIQSRWKELLDAERVLLLDDGDTSVVCRKVEAFAQFVEKRLEVLRPGEFADVRGSAALQIRLCRHRLREARYQLIQRLDLGHRKVALRHRLSLQEPSEVLGSGETGFNISGHAASFNHSDDHDAIPAAPVSHRLSDEPAKT